MACRVLFAAALCAAIIGFAVCDNCRAWTLGQDEVLIYDVGLQVPQGWILLVRKGTEYCALKFLQFRSRLDVPNSPMHAQYEVWPLGDGNIGPSTIEPQTGELFSPRHYGIYPFEYTKEEGKSVIECGRIRLLWHFDGALWFRGPDMHWFWSTDTEFAPTAWKSIDEVDIHDRRLQWYKHGTVNDNVLCKIKSGKDDESDKFLRDCTIMKVQ